MWIYADPDGDIIPPETTAKLLKLFMQGVTMRALHDDHGVRPHDIQQITKALAEQGWGLEYSGSTKKYRLDRATRAAIREMLK